MDAATFLRLASFPFPSHRYINKPNYFVWSHAVDFVPSDDRRAGDASPPFNVTLLPSITDPGNSTTPATTFNGEVYEASWGPFYGEANSSIVQLSSKIPAGSYQLQFEYYSLEPLPGREDLLIIQIFGGSDDFEVMEAGQEVAQLTEYTGGAVGRLGSGSGSGGWLLAAGLGVGLLWL